MKRYKCVLLILGLLAATITVEESIAETEVMISAALSLKAPFEDIGRIYEKKYPGPRAVFNFGPSGALQKQIERGAPADVFASASSKEVDSLESAGLIVSGTRIDFAGNSIALIAASNATVRLTAFNDLVKNTVVRIAIGNPASVPAGKYAEEALKNMGLWDNLKAKLVYGEHVRQVMDYVARGEVDAGIVFLTDALSRSRELEVVAEAPASVHTPVLYTIAAVTGTKNETAARNFIAIVVSKEGKEVLRKHGFIVNLQK